MDLSKQIFTYCERGQDPSFWAEPVNAITNAAFAIAAIAAFVLWLRQPADKRRVVDLGLIGLVVVIGTGSFLFHTTATIWASLADTIPIGIFMVSYFAYCLRCYLKLNWAVTLGLLGLFVLSLWQASVVRCEGGPCLNGSVAYFPAFVALLVVGGLLKLRSHLAGSSLIAAGLIFAVSLTFRSIDNSICQETVLAGVRDIPLGTHFLWHVLNATLLYLLLRASILYGGSPSETKSAVESSPDLGAST